MIDRTRTYKTILLAIFFTLLAVSCFKPVYPAEMFLQHSVTVAVSIFLIMVTLKNSLSDKSFTLVVCFMLLHVAGARWIYSYVPYEEWFRSVAGSVVSGWFHSTRNNYDRFVHILFGLMMFSR